MMESFKSSSNLLAVDEEASEKQFLCSRCEAKLSGKKRNFSQLQMLLLLVTIQGILTYLGFTAFGWAKSNAKFNFPDDYLELAHYNLTRQDFGIINAADPSPEADQFWDDVTGTSGIVAVDGRWAQTLGLPSTVPHPTDGELALYQVNAFHSLHCLYRIRNRLIADIPLTAWPRADIHTLHCVDHIRKDLMCNSDISLHGSSNYVDFGVQPQEGSQCRDLNAVQRWVERNAWSGFGSFLKGSLNYDPVKIEAEVHRQKLALEHERHEKIPWHKVETSYNNVTGEITLTVL